MKLKVTEVAFYDKVEEKYIYKDKTPTIEREEERGRQPIKAGVCEEIIEADEETIQTEETESEVETEEVSEKTSKGWFRK